MGECMHTVRCFAPLTTAHLVHFVILVAAMLWVLRVLEESFAPVGQWVLGKRWRQSLIWVLLVAPVLLQLLGVRPPWLS